MCFRSRTQALEVSEGVPLIGSPTTGTSKVCPEYWTLYCLCYLFFCGDVGPSFLGLWRSSATPPTLLYVLYNGFTTGLQSNSAHKDPALERRNFRSEPAWLPHIPGGSGVS